MFKEGVYQYRVYNWLVLSLKMLESDDIIIFDYKNLLNPQFRIQNYDEHDDEFYHYRVYLHYYIDYDDRDFRSSFLHYLLRQQINEQSRKRSDTSTDRFCNMNSMRVYVYCIGGAHARRRKGWEVRRASSWGES